jgi:toxin-antitoxin system PIN domain toxin
VVWSRNSRGNVPFKSGLLFPSCVPNAPDPQSSTMPRSSKSFLFPDVNVWLALTWEGHAHHAIARAWFEGLDVTTRLGFCRFTQISLLRLLTTQAVMGPELMTQAEAWTAYDRWMQDSRILFLDEPANVEPVFRSESRRTRSESKGWADAYLAAFATIAEMKLVTFDRGFEGRLEQLLILRP